MSVQLMGAVISCGPQDRTQFCLLVALANYADDFGFAFPSIATIAADARCDLRTAMRQIAELEQSGWVYVVRKVLNGKSNVYQLNTERLGVTVPPTARRNPLFTRLLRTHGDAMSPIFAPQKSSDTTTFSGDNPQPSQVTSDPTQVTKEGGSSDTACHPIRHNRHESIRQGTVNEVEPVPPTPAGGGQKSGIVQNREHEHALRAQRWDLMRLALKLDLGSLAGKSRNFHPIRAGIEDFDLCFSHWWFAHIGRVGIGWTFVTDADDRAATETGIAKYERRLIALAREYFAIPKEHEVKFIVREPAQKETAA